MAVDYERLKLKSEYWCCGEVLYKPESGDTLKVRVHPGGRGRTTAALSARVVCAVWERIHSGGRRRCACTPGKSDGPGESTASCALSVADANARASLRSAHQHDLAK
jgi:hypothetical protein